MNLHRIFCRRSKHLTATGVLLALLACGSVEVVRADVQVSGLDGRLERNVRAFLSLASAGCDSGRLRIERLYKDSGKEIRSALQALGYYEPTIDASLTWDESCWQARFEVTPGEPVRYRSVDILINEPAATDAAFNARLDVPRPVTGEILDHGLYEGFKTSILRAATRAGFFEADFVQSDVVVDRDAHAADVNIEFDSGTKYRFGQVSFSDGILRRRLLAGYTDIRPGDPYSARAISQLYEALNGSNYFASVSILTDPLDTDEKTVPVNVVLTPSKRRVYSAGAGYTTDSGPHLRLGFTNRRINDKGHQLESKLYTSTIRTELNATYRWPHRDPRREWFSVVTGFQHENTETSRHDTYKLGISRSRKRGESWLETRYLDVEREDFTVADQESTSQLLIVGTNWETARGRALSRVKNGHRLSIDVRGASDSLGSDTSFAQLRSNVKWIHSFGDKTRVLARASVGATMKKEFSELPASVRFFSGGDRSVRGYEYESLGPIDADGDVIGGAHQVDASLEVDYLVADRWSIAVFTDSGSAFNDGDIEFSSGVGLGVRWYSPVGPIRVDFAHPLDDPDNDLRVHISLGPDL
jgi:translocation and assembly module TamA